MSSKKPFYYQFVYVWNCCAINTKLVVMLFHVWLRSCSFLQTYIFSLNTVTWLRGILILLWIWSFFRLTEIIFVTIKQKAILLVSAFASLHKLVINLSWKRLILCICVSFCIVSHTINTEKCHWCRVFFITLQITLVFLLGFMGFQNIPNCKGFVKTTEWLISKICLNILFLKFYSVCRINL